MVQTDYVSKYLVVAMCRVCADIFVAQLSLIHATGNIMAVFQKIHSLFPLVQSDSTDVFMDRTHHAGSHNGPGSPPLFTINSTPLSH